METDKFLRKHAPLVVVALLFETSSAPAFERSESAKIQLLYDDIDKAISLDTLKSDNQRIKVLESIQRDSLDVTIDAAVKGLSPEHQKALNESRGLALRGLALSTEIDRKEIQYRTERINQKDNQNNIQDDLEKVARKKMAKNVSVTKDERLRVVARSVAMLVSRNDVSETTAGSLLRGIRFKDDARLCDGERFADEWVVGKCTAFLVASDVIATANHCVKDEDLAQLLAVFDYVQDETPLQVSAVYEILGLISMSKETGQDWALLRLRRPVDARTPLRVLHRVPVLKEKVTMVGHPNGLPKKIAGGAEVRENKDFTFISNLDAFHKNSGSPILTESGEVVGMLIRGEKDHRFVTVGDGWCRAVAVCPDDSCSGEVVLKAGTFSSSIDKVL